MKRTVFPIRAGLAVGLEIEVSGMGIEKIGLVRGWTTIWVALR